MKIQNIDNVLDSFIVFFSKLKKQLKTKPSVTIKFDNLRQLQLSRTFISSLLHEEEYELPTNVASIFNEAKLEALFYLHKGSDKKLKKEQKAKQKAKAESKKISKKQKKLEKAISKKADSIKLTPKQAALAEALDKLTIKNIIAYFKTQNVSLPKAKSFPVKSTGIENIVVSFDNTLIEHHLKELKKFQPKKGK